MCVSVDKADFRNTTLLISEARHPATGKKVHVLGYQNAAVSYSSGPNAMILHFPAHPMTQENVVDTSGFPWFLQDLVHAVTPPSLGRSIPGAAGVEVFDHGIYTVVLAANASFVFSALPLVPEEKRPPFNQRLFDWYGSMWPDWPVALCCFNNRQAAQADPMLWWYEPLDDSWLLAPSIDCHTGEVPDLDADVAVDHWVIAGLQERRFPNLVPVRYRDETAIPAFAAALLPSYVVGVKIETRLQNGDFLFPANKLAVREARRGVLLDGGRLQGSKIWDSPL